MEKPIINQNQADRIWAWEWRKNNPSKLLELHAKKVLSDSKCLQSLSLDQLARAIYVGYEVEEHFKVGDWVVNTCHNSIFQLEQSEVKDFFERIPVLKHIRHATESEIADKKGRILDKKTDKILLDLEPHERTRLREKLECGDY